MKLFNINECSLSTKVSLNVAKSKYMKFQTAKKNIHILTLNIENVYIEQVEE
jgi:hypothetical protein